MYSSKANTYRYPYNSLGFYQDYYNVEIDQAAIKHNTGQCQLL